MFFNHPRLRHVSLKLERAKVHATQLNDVVKAYIALNPYQVDTRRDPESRKLIYFVSSVLPPPDELPLLIGDAIQNLSTSLDHLAYQIVCNDTHDAPPKAHGIYFPISDDQKQYEASKVKKLLGATPHTVACFDAIKPYREGNENLWRLNRLNNIEKHRLLLTVGSQAAGIHLGQLMSSLLSGAALGNMATTMEGMNLYLNPADKGFPLQQGFELYIGQVDEQPNPKQQFRFELVFNEFGVAESLNVVETVSALVAEVETVVSRLAPLIQ